MKCISSTPIFFIILIFICCVGSVHGQHIKLYGYVKDSLGNPLLSANVIAKPQNPQKKMQFDITDDEGFYSIKFQKGDTITIDISYLGYLPLSYRFIATQSLQKNFILKQATTTLDEVLIEMPVTIRGDTTLYKTEKFIDGSERKLKNILKKLPGIDVSKDGEVTVKGKKLNKMLVDGRKFFGGNTKLAIDNIPANAVGDIQVIDNYNEVSFLKNIVGTEELAMNIQLKKDKKNFIFGNIEAGKGNQNFHKLATNLFYYSPKTTVNFIGNTNNIGEKTFTFKDYINFSGGVNAIFKGDFNWSAKDLTQFIENKDITKSNEHFGAFNIVKKTSNFLDISLYGIVSATKSETKEGSNNQYTTYIEQKDRSNSKKNLSGVGNLVLEYTPNKQEKWYARTQIKNTNNRSENLLISTINSNVNNLSKDNDLDELYFNQNVEWHKKQSEKHTLSSIFNYKYATNNQNSFWQTNDSIFNGLIPVLKQQVYQINQLKNDEEQNIDVVFKHFWEINNMNHIYTTIGNKLLLENFVTDDSQILDNESQHSFKSNGFDNNLDFLFNDLFLGVHYRFKTGIFTIKQGVFVRQYNWKVGQDETTNKRKRFLLPETLVKIEFSRSKKVTFNYAMKTSFSNAKTFANRYLLQSYNSIYKGNPTIENELYHYANINYFRFSMFKGLMLTAGLTYYKQVKGIRNSVEFENTNQFLTSIQVQNPSEKIEGKMRVEKRIKKIKSKLIFHYNKTNFKQQVNDEVQKNKNNKYGYEISIETLFKKFPTIELGFKRNINNVFANNATTEFITMEPFATFDYSFENGFIFNFDYSKNYFQNKTQGQNNKYEIANAYFSYKNENSKWMYKITANNLFNAQFKQSNSFTDYLIIDKKNFILPRVFLFSVSYNL